MTNDLASVHTRAGRTDPKMHFLKSLFQVFRIFQISGRKKVYRSVINYGKHISAGERF